MEWLTLLIGLIVGGLAAWFLGKAQARDSLGIVRQQIEEKDREILKLRELYDTERVEHAGLKSRWEESEKKFLEMQQFAEQTKEALKGTFASLSKEALTSSNEQFLQLAKSQLGELVTDAKGDLGKRQEAIEGSVKPLNDALKRYDEQVQRLSEGVERKYGDINKSLESIIAASKDLHSETGQLVQALRSPHVRGRWGEITLRRAAELAGMTEHCDFEEQVSDDSGKLRPDMIVNLPDDRRIVVDAKTPIEAYMQMIESSDEEERKRLLLQHASHVRTHMKQLSLKQYWDQFEHTPDYVVMFIPSEAFFSSAAMQDHRLIEDGLNNKVILCSPTTFIALLRTIELGWRHERIAKNAAEISALGKQLYERISTFTTNFSKLGRALDGAVGAYNDSAGTLESRVLVSTRRFKELGATAQSDIEAVKQIEKSPRTVQADEPSDEDVPEASSTKDKTLPRGASLADERGRTLFG